MTKRAEIEIRQANPTDEPAIRACVEVAYQPYVDRIGRRPAPMLDDYHDLIGRAVVSVAAIDGNVLGLIVMWPEQDHHYVDNIAVHPSAQGHGVGTALLAHAEATARAANRDEIRLYTNEAMTENIDYYPRRGFVETHREVEVGYRRIYYSRHLA